MGKNKPRQGKDAYLRMNFLYQAAHTIMATTPNSENIVSHLGACMVKIGKKNLLRIDKGVKKGICKGCSNVLVPGITATARRRSKKGRKRVVITCLLCSTVKGFHVRGKYRKKGSGVPGP